MNCVLQRVADNIMFGYESAPHTHQLAPYLKFEAML